MSWIEQQNWKSDGDRSKLLSTEQAPILNAKCCCLIGMWLSEVIVCHGEFHIRYKLSELLETDAKTLVRF
jgi:hypothetical protein